MAFFDDARNERNARERALTEMEGRLGELAALRAVQDYGGSLGDAGQTYKMNADGTTESWFKAGDVVGVYPVRPE